jgi:tripartite motif-containing protein 33
LLCLVKLSRKMATFSQSTLDKGCDFVQDFLCSTCEDKKLDNTADFYCESCVKFYCRKCIGMHSQLFTKHAPFGRGDMKKWPVAKKVEDFLLKCDVHKEENLKMFCDEHSELCCTNCAFLNHRYIFTLL